MSLVRILILAFVLISASGAPSIAQEADPLRKLGVTNFHEKSVTVTSLPDIRSEAVGFEILALDHKSLLFNMGIRNNDIVLEIDGYQFTSRESFIQTVKNMLKSHDKASVLKVNRNGSSFYIILGKKEKKRFMREKR